MADEAVGPDVAEFTVCGRAVDMPVAGSAFPAGHNPLVGFFLAQLPAGSVGVEGTPLVCAGDAVMVDVEELVELVEAIDEDEFCRGSVFLVADVNILLTSSEFIAKPLPLEVGHPNRVLG